MPGHPQRDGRLPPVNPPEPWAGKLGQRKGWKFRIPGDRPLATPAVAAGRVFLGGGFGSYEFYALDAATGAVHWQYRTRDDGPTAAVVEGDYVVFNTESCELEVLSVNGQPLWKHWLGDPLMSMPAVGAGRVFMAYPDTRGDGEHYLAAFDIACGRQLWRTRIAGEIITAPVLADDHVYFTTLDGTLHCCRQEDGGLSWQEAATATSSPVVVDGTCYFSRRETSRDEQGRVQQHEHCASRECQPGSPIRGYARTRRKADYLDHGKRRRGSPKFRHMAHHDVGVGFAAFKGSAKIHQAMRNLGHGSVAGVWGYQGSKPFFRRGRLYSSLGDTVHGVNVAREADHWKRQLGQQAEDAELLDAVVTPPALVNGKVFVGTAQGDVVALSDESGEVLWHEQVAGAIDFQLAVVRGRVYVPTRQGVLYCLETGDEGDDGWCMWGATPAHNGQPEAAPTATG